ncbi:MAG: ABC transporter ATP-binding protein [Lachnospiraceae bacterium]|nr:ABC transporter ATP-binding protein [Lachnospiraceae bacterium]
MLTCTSITKTYRGKPAVDSLSAKLEPGHIYGLLGPNGSGKSTWMKMMAGLVTCEEGEITFEGSPLNIPAKRDIVYMPTEPYFYSYMKISNVGNYNKDFFENFDEELWKYLLAKMELTPERKVSQLSSGMMAKLKVAAALSRKAKLYLLDEPLNGIDLLARESIITSVIECMSEDSSVMISSHLVEELEKTIDRVVFLREGKIVLTGDVEDLRAERQKSIVDIYKEIYR